MVEDNFTDKKGIRVINWYIMTISRINIFHSHNIWFKPAPYLKDSIMVKWNLNNYYTQYIVETEL